MGDHESWYPTQPLPDGRCNNMNGPKVESLP